VFGAIAIDSFASPPADFRLSDGNIVRAILPRTIGAILMAVTIRQILLAAARAQQIPLLAVRRGCLASFAGVLVVTQLLPLAGPFLYRNGFRAVGFGRTCRLR
jgi:hypothetical protein